jgi:hypothetical protein
MRLLFILIALYSLASSLGIQARAQDSAQPARVVFVCEHGSVKSREFRDPSPQGRCARAGN